MDAGEHVSVAVKREFMEEALDATTKDADEKRNMEAMVDKFFKRGEEVYKGADFFDFEKCLLHGPISMKIPDNKATKYPQARGYLHQKRVGRNTYVHKITGGWYCAKIVLPLFRLK